MLTNSKHQKGKHTAPMSQYPPALLLKSARSAAGRVVAGPLKTAIQEKSDSPSPNKKIACRAISRCPLPSPIAVDETKHARPNDTK
jgi:hypothetical protein